MKVHTVRQVGSRTTDLLLGMRCTHCAKRIHGGDVVLTHRVSRQPLDVVVVFHSACIDPLAAKARELRGLPPDVSAADEYEQIRNAILDQGVPFPT